MKTNTSNNERQDIYNNFNKELFKLADFEREQGRLSVLKQGNRNKEPMKPNTSNKEELLCDICKKYPDNNCSKCNKIKQGIKQGYAKALDDVIEMIDNVSIGYFGKLPIPQLKNSIAKLKEKTK
jgi:hypothetical protein